MKTMFYLNHFEGHILHALQGLQNVTDFVCLLSVNFLLLWITLYNHVSFTSCYSTFEGQHLSQPSTGCQSLFTTTWASLPVTLHLKVIITVKHQWLPVTLHNYPTFDPRHIVLEGHHRIQPSVTSSDSLQPLPITLHWSCNTTVNRRWLRVTLCNPKTFTCHYLHLIVIASANHRWLPVTLCNCNTFTSCYLSFHSDHLSEL